MLLLDHTCDIHRNKALGTNGRKAMQLIASGVACLGLPMGSNATIQNEMQIGRSYEFTFAPEANVQVGDKLVWKSKTMIVRHVRDYDTYPVSHLEVLCEQEVA